MAKNKYLDLTGLNRFLTKLKTLFATVTHTHKIADVTDFAIDASLSSTSTNPVQNKAVKTALNSKMDLFSTKSYYANSTDGIAYTVTVPDISTFSYGTEFNIYINKVVATTTPTLNVNGLGDWEIRAKPIMDPGTTVMSIPKGALRYGEVYRVGYRGSYWEVLDALLDLDGAGVRGPLALANGGTGQSTIDKATAALSYPVGAIYISYTSTSPSSLFGGSWVQIKDKFLRTATDVSTGGSATHKHYIPCGKAVSDGFWVYDVNQTNSMFGWRNLSATSINNAYMAYTDFTSYTQKSTVLIATTSDPIAGASANAKTTVEPGDCLPPYQDVYAWRRIA